MGKDEYLNRFREECRSCQFYQERIEKIDQKIHLLDLKMQNVKSPELNKIGQSPSRHEISYPQLIAEKEKLQKDRYYYESHIQWVKETIDMVPSPAYRALIWATYVERKSLHTIADTENVSKDMLYKKRKRFISYALSDERIRKLDEIEKQKEEPVH